MEIPFRMVMQHEMVIDGLCLGEEWGRWGSFYRELWMRLRQGIGHCPGCTAEAGGTPTALLLLSKAAPVGVGIWFA